ncbi:signal peptidase II [Mobilitalea sibirica]|uniref:Lipoprotein signal peptidase n=1 Tax=Mobilitalea sibirica TaxID=1462919 RepID=A0A8J7HBA7_9FIRM|nr:signal peptidase II [Mobilitalea sibirica]MBH1940886.1 signal peptidase II [Mobilitalea sibirica]
MNKQRLRHLFYFIILLLIDQGSKYWARTILINEPVNIIPKVFILQYHENTGAVWGIMSGQIGFLILLTAIILMILIYMYLKIPQDKKYNIIKIIWVFLIAGAVGNFIDRMFLRYVVDFLYFELIDFPIFNIADSYLTVSCALLLILALFYYKDEDFDFIDEIFTRKKKNRSKQDTTGKDA